MLVQVNQLFTVQPTDGQRSGVLAIEWLACDYQWEQMQSSNPILLPSLWQVARAADERIDAVDESQLLLLRNAADAAQQQRRHQRGRLEERRQKRRRGSRQVRRDK